MCASYDVGIPLLNAATDFKVELEACENDLTFTTV